MYESNDFDDAMFGPNYSDDFDTQLQPEDLQDDNPIDEDFGFDAFDENLIDGFCDDGMGHEFDEGSDRDNWEEEQVFRDGPEW